MHHDLTLEDAAAVLAAQPFSVLLGARLTAFGDGTAEIRVPLRSELLQQFGFAHGGVLAYVADNSLTFAGGTVLGASVVTRGFTIDYLRPARGLEVVARADVVNHSSTQAVCRCDVFAVDESRRETLVAAAQGTISTIDLGRTPVPTAGSC